MFPNDAIYCFRDISRYKTLKPWSGHHVNIIMSPCYHVISFQLLLTFGTFFQFLAIHGNLRQLLARFCNFWYLLATPATFLIFCTFLPILVHIGNFCHNVILSSHPVISSCHLLLSSLLVILSSCNPVILSSGQLVNLPACELFSLRILKLASLLDTS